MRKNQRDEPPANGKRVYRAKGRAPRKAGQLNPLERYQRAKVITEMRARRRPVAWKDIAKHVGLSASQAQEIHVQFLSWIEPQNDPMKAVDDTIDTLTVAVQQAWETYQAAPEGSSVRVQALKAAVEGAVARLQIMRAAGRAPRSLSAPTVAQEMQRVFQEFAQLLRRHKVGDDALRDFLELAEGQMGRLTAIDAPARVLPG